MVHRTRNKPYPASSARAGKRTRNLAAHACWLRGHDTCSDIVPGRARPRKRARNSCLGVPCGRIGAAGTLKLLRGLGTGQLGFRTSAGKGCLPCARSSCKARDSGGGGDELGAAKYRGAAGRSERDLELRDSPALRQRSGRWNGGAGRLGPLDCRMPGTYDCVCGKVRRARQASNRDARVVTRGSEL